MSKVTATPRRFKVTLKRVILADVYVEAANAAEARRQVMGDDDGFEYFNMSDSFHGEDIKVASVVPAPKEEPL